jgi:DNA-binding helix-hairpin-helix protein with protein kinase domain
VSARQFKAEVVDSQGRQIILGAVLGKGGEGTVYEVKQESSTVAKVYHKPLNRDRTDKIRLMAHMRTDVLSKFTSWPMDLLETKHTREPIGLLMPRVINRKNIHHLYGPKSRLQDFPRADWRFLVRTATNTAWAFAVVHDARCVIGDVNHSSIMVAEDATVRLIDCDSFQVNASGRQFLCEVGIETFTPPELQGLPFRGAVRTPNYDNFGLAVLIFHLLFMGRHPFAGRYSGAGEMPIARAIKECRFPYGSSHLAVRMERPPGTPPLSFIGPEVSQLFETAFSQAAIQGGRPTSREWAVALQRLEANIRVCGNNKGHWYPSYSSGCPWCQMEAKGANPLFPFVIPLAPGHTVPTVDLEALWRQLQGLSSLGPAPPIPVPVATPSPAAKQAVSPLQSMANLIAMVVSLGVFIGGTYLVPFLFWIFGLLAITAYNFVQARLSNKEHVDRFRVALVAAEANFNRVNADWQSRAGEGSFQQAKRNFEKLRAELNSMPSKRLRALDQLKRNQHQLQLDRFLDKYEIEDAKIEGIGPGRKRTLESYGIETAEDLVRHRLEAVPGFGPKMIDRLMQWRKSLEAKFNFNPAKAIDPRDIAKVEQDILSQRVKLEAAAKAAYAEALQAHTRIISVRTGLRPQLENLQALVACARADYEYVRRG